MKKAIMYGAGNIGRGFIGQLLSQSGYEVVFIDVNLEVVEALNREGQYPIRFVRDSGNEEVIIAPVRAVLGFDAQRVAEEISGADLMATAVGAGMLPEIAENIASGIRHRWKKLGHRSLDIIICENLMGADHYLKDLVMAHMCLKEKETLEKHVGFVAASIGRMVPVSTPEMQEGNLLRVCVEAYDALPVDRGGFRGEIPSIKQLIPYSPFDFYVQRKLYVHNMGHAITAYLGHMHDYLYIWEAIEDSGIKKTVHGAMLESAHAIALEHGVEIRELEAYVEDLVQRFGNHELGDTVTRVGKDLVRKLSPDDRLVGALSLCEKHHMSAENIEKGIAAALACAEDFLGERLIFPEKNRNALVLQHICGLSPESKAYHHILKIANELVGE